jgi:uncharacterized protein (DUF2141 family)
MKRRRSTQRTAQGYRIPALGMQRFCLLAASGLAQAQEAKLVVDLHNIRDAKGHLRASLYSEAETFRKEDRALKIVSIPAVRGNAQVFFTGLPPGRYAIMAYHDENDDEQLNLRFGMFPTEGYGLSNNPTVRGPPKFADSAFEVSSPQTSVSIEINY